MKAYGGLDLRLHSFLTFSLDEREWSASRLDCFTLEKAAPNNRWLGGWVGPSSCLGFREGKTVFSLSGINFSAAQRVAYAL
jgi:hypothetical protein